MMGVNREQVAQLSGGAIQAGPLPPPRPDFMGRAEEVAEVIAAVREGAGAAIYGMGGVGKTQLALTAARRMAGEFAEVIYLGPLQREREVVTAGALMGTIIRALRPDVTLPRDESDLRGLYGQVVKRRPGLLVLDDIAGVEQVGRLLPLPEGWKLVVTSRERLILPGIRAIKVGIFAEDQSVALLRRLLHEWERKDAATEETALVQLGALCGRLPLALRLAAEALAQLEWPMEEFIAALAKDRLGMLEVGGESVARVLGTSVERLARKDTTLARRWEMLVVFPAPFDREAAAALWQVDAAEAREALVALRQQSLVDYDPEQDVYVLHDLLREYALGVTGDGVEEARRRHAEHYLKVGARADDLYAQGGQGMMAGLRRFGEAWPHLRAAWEWMMGQEGRDVSEWLRDFPLVMAHLLDLRVPPARRLGILETALERARELGDLASEAVVLDQLGIAYHNLGDVRRAIDVHEQRLDIAREVGDRRAEGRALGNLGTAYYALGDARRAIELYEQRLEIARQIGDRRAEGIGLGNLGTAYHALGDSHRAISYHEQALQIARETGDRQAEGSTLSNLGAVYYNLENAHQAVELYEQGLEIAREIGDRRAEGTALGGLGLTYHALGRIQQAIELHEQRLELACEVGDRRGEGRALGNLGTAYQALGNTERAIEFLEQALVIAREIGDREGQAIGMQNLAQVHRAIGEYGRAAELLAVAMEYEREMGRPRAERTASLLEEVQRLQDVETG